MKSNEPHISCVIIWLFSVIQVYSQNQVSVTATTNRNQILIGEPIQLTLEAKLPLGMKMTWFPLDSIPHFDFIEKGKLDSAVTEDGKNFRQDVVLTSFDSGTFVIPSLPLVLNSQRYLTDSITIQVSYSKINPNQDYHDIKDIIEVQNPSLKYLIWVIVAVTVTSLLLFIYYVRRKRPMPSAKAPEIVLPTLSAYDEAMNALNALKDENLPASGEIKLYYTRLNDIFKRFIFRKLQISSLSKTNDELIMQLRQVDISRERFSELTEALRMSDFVKFAKYIPDETQRSQSFTVIRHSIDFINEISR